MAYTNGFDSEKVLTALMGRVGWRDQQGAPAMDGLNSTRLSGRAFQDFHAAVDLSRLKEAQGDSAIADDAFNNYLQDLQKSVIVKCLNGVFREPELKDDTKLFDRLMYYDQEINNSGQFVGVRFRVPQKHIAIRVTEITLLFNQDVQFNLYLYSDVKKDPLWQQTVNAIAHDQVTIIPDTEIMMNKGGFYYLGYFQDDLGSAKAIWEQPSMQKTYCFGYDFVQSKADPVARTFEKRMIGYNNQTYGLNLRVSSFTDKTDSIVNNAHLFDEVIGLQMAVNVIEQYQYSTRGNSTQRIAAEQSKELYTDLNMDKPSEEYPFTTGLKGKVNRELKRIAETFYPKPKSSIVNVGCEG
jgi:hypothetical protein